MASGFESPSFCGHCGASLEEGVDVCPVCGTAVSSQAPPDYVPYCRSCGVGVPWGRGHTCLRCGLTPLCGLHFNAANSLCFDCAAVPSSPQGAATAGGLRCGACGNPVSPNTEFCANCGRPVSFRAVPDAAEYMGFWIRAGAFVVDRIIAYLIAAAIATAIGISRTSGDTQPPTQQEIEVSLETLNYSFFLLVWGCWVAYSVVLTSWRGQTIGKMLLGMQVVDSEGNIPPWYRIFFREVIGKFVSEIILYLGYFSIGWDQEKRGWHDHLSGSYVVRKRRAARPPGGMF